MTTLININKDVSSSYAKVGSKLSYSITLQNISQLQANNVIVTDSIPNILSFIPESLVTTGSNLGSGNQLTIYLGNMLPGALSTILFDVKIDTIPNNGLIENSSNIGYRYTLLNTLPNAEIGTGTSNKVQTIVKEAIIKNDSFVKTSTPEYATSGDTITYSISMKNTGNTTANNVVLIDTIPTGTTLINDSIIVNGTLIPGESPEAPSGLPIGNIAPNNTSTIVFKVLVDTTPSLYNITNNSTTYFTYTIDDSTPNAELGAGTSNTATTTINKAIIDLNSGFSKTVSPLYAKSTDTLTYTIGLKNTGNVRANNIVLKDTLPTGLEYISNTLKINNVTIPAGNPTSSNGIFIGFLTPGATSTVVYKAKINNLNAGNIFSSKATVDYSYIVDPNSQRNKNYTGYSNTSTVKVEQPIINNPNIIKNVDKRYSPLNDVITYTFNIDNKTSTSAINSVLIDTIPNELSFIEDSLTFNNKILSTYSHTLPNTLIINIDTIPSSCISTLSFRVLVNTIPLIIENLSTLEYTYSSDSTIPGAVLGSINSNNVLTQVSGILENEGFLHYSYKLDEDSDVIFNSSATSNRVSTILNEAIIDNARGEFVISSTPSGGIGDEITYTLTMKNVGNVDAYNINLSNTIPIGIKYIKDSVYVDGINLVGIKPEEGINIDLLKSGEKVTLTFKGLIDSIPSSRVFENSASVMFNYTLDPSNPNGAIGYGNSNITSTSAFLASLDLDVLYSKYTTINKEFEYAFTLANTGNTIANNIIFINTIPNGLSFIDNSLNIDGSIHFGKNPQKGINLNSLDSGKETVISFKVLANSIPSINPIQNSAYISFTYGNDDSNVASKSGALNSGILETQVNAPLIDTKWHSLTKNVDKLYVDKNDTLTYNIEVINSGNVSAENVLIFDSLPQEISFVPNSIKVNGENRLGDSIESGLSLNNIDINEVLTITFKAKVKSLIPDTQINNNCSVYFDFLMNPEEYIYDNNLGISNSVVSTVNYAIINSNGFNTSIDSNLPNETSYSSIGDILTYNISLKNTGNVDANNIIFKDTIPDGLLIIEDSFEINGENISYSPLDNLIDINLGFLSLSNTKTLSYRVMVTTIPEMNPIQTNGYVTFTYKVSDDSISETSSYGYSNTCKLQINQAIIDNSEGGLTQISSPSHVMVGDNITYTFVLKNTGNVDATNVVLIDTLPVETSLIQNSISVEGENPIIVTTIDPNIYNAKLKYSLSENSLSIMEINNKMISKLDINKIKELNLDSSTGVLSIDVGNIKTGSIATVSFTVNLDTVPTSNIITNKASTEFNYNKNPNIPNSGTGIGYSNEVVTNMVEAIINVESGFNKSVNKDYATVGDTLTYEISLTNTGTTTANNIIFTETLQNSLEILENSIHLNGVTVPNNDIANLKVTIGSIEIANTSTLSFQATVLNIPEDDILNLPSSIKYTYTIDPSTPNSEIKSGISNVTVTTINYADINENTFTIIPSVYVAKENDVISFAINIGNIGNVPANELLFNLPLPNELQLVSSSILINGIPAQSEDLYNGLILNSLEPNNHHEITFDTKVISLPENGFVTLTGGIHYAFTVNPKVPNEILKIVHSTPLEIQINEAIIDSDRGLFNLEFDKTNIGINDTVTATATLKNTGNTIAENLYYLDTLPNYLSFVENSIKVNDESKADLTILEPTGLSLNNLAKDSITTVSYMLKAVEISDDVTVSNKSAVSFNYKMDSNSNAKTNGKGVSNLSEVNILDANFNPEKGGFTLVCDKSKTHIDDILTFTIILTNLGNVDANNILLRLNEETNMNLIKDSLLIDGNPYYQENPSLQIGINLANMPAKSTRIVKFQEKVTDSESKLTLSARGILDYTFTVDPSIPNDRNGEYLSNQVSIPIKSAIMNNKSGGHIIVADKKYVNVGGELTFTVTLLNTGNMKAYNVMLSSKAPEGTEFMANSITINDISVDGNIENGVNIGTLDAHSKTVVIYKVKILSKLTEEIQSDTMIEYEYTMEDDAEVITQQSVNSNSLTTFANDGMIRTSSMSNPLSITVVDGSMRMIHTVDKEYAYKGDTLTYTIELSNIGDVLAEDVIILNTLPDSLSFKEGSLKINSALMEGLNPLSPFNIGNIPIATTTNISLEAIVKDTITSNTVQNLIGVTYSYIVDPNQPKLLDSINALSDITTLTGANIAYNDGGFVLSVDKENVTYDDIITCTLFCKNTGNARANDIQISSIIPVGLDFIDGSGTINGLAHIFNPENGIQINSLMPEESTTITFKAKVLKDNKALSFEFKAFVDYNYIVDPDEAARTTTNESNVATINFKMAKIVLTEIPNKKIAEINSDIIFTITAKNIGNIDAQNIDITSILPPSTLFREGSLAINGVLKSIEDITKGITIDTLSSNSEVHLSFSAEVIKLPLDGLISTFSEATYNYLLSPGSPLKSDTSISNDVKVSVTMPIGDLKTIPNNDEDSSTCYGNKALYDNHYSIYGVCTPTDHVRISEIIKKYNMWTYNSVDYSIDLRESNLSKIDSVTGSLEIIRTDVIETANSNGIPNMEGKILTGFEQIIDVVGKIKINYTTRDGRKLCKEVYKTVPSYIVLNPNFNKNLLNVQGCFEDITITGMKNGILKLSSLMLLFMVSITENIENDYCTVLNTKCLGLSKNNIIPELQVFLSPSDRCWNEFNICFSEEVPFSINSVVDAFATTSINSIELIDGIYSPNQSSEGLNLTGKKLVVNMTVSLTIHYYESKYSRKVEKLCGEIPCTTNIVVPREFQENDKFMINSCIENIYVCPGIKNIFTNTTIIVKVNQAY